MNSAWDIQLQKLRLGYGDTVVIEELTASLPAGKISMILGGSGCGKSTLLRHILGLMPPMEGSIILGGNDFFKLPKKKFHRIRRRMGVLFQDGALLGSLTLADNVTLPLTEHTKLQKKLIRELALQRLDLVGLADFADYYPGQLSGGMRKRAGLARAIVVNPPILLCDEPTSGLDPINAAQMDELLLSLKAQFPTMTIVVVSHDLSSVDVIADHVLLLHEGKPLFEGSREKLKQSNDAYIKRFLNREADQEKIRRAGMQRLSLDPVIQKSLEAWLEK